MTIPSIRVSSLTDGSWDYQQGWRNLGYDPTDMVQLGNPAHPPQAGDLRLVLQTVHFPSVLLPYVEDEGPGTGPGETGTSDLRWSSGAEVYVDAPVYVNVQWWYRYVDAAEAAGPFQYSYWTVAGPSSGVGYQIAEFIIKDADSPSPFFASSWRVQSPTYSASEPLTLTPPWMTDDLMMSRAESLLIGYWVAGPPLVDAYAVEDVSGYYTPDMQLELRQQGRSSPSPALDGPIMVVASDPQSIAQAVGARALNGPDVEHVTGCGLLEIRSPLPPPPPPPPPPSITLGPIVEGVARFGVRA